MDFESTQTARSRLLIAAKQLFARSGYEQTSTSSIAREAGTSESQLVRYFGGKAGLLEALFNESWKALGEVIQTRLASAGSAKQSILEILRTLVEAFSADHAMAAIFLFEGRRIRGGDHEVQLSQGFLQFTGLLEGLIRRAREEGDFRNRFSDAALLSALIGAAEAMIRDRLIAERAEQPSPFTTDEIQEVMKSILEGL